MRMFIVGTRFVYLVWMDGCSVTVQALKTTMLVWVWVCVCVLCVCVCGCDHLTACCHIFYDWTLARKMGMIM